MNNLSFLFLFLLVLPFQVFSQCEGWENYPLDKNETYKNHILYRDYIKQIQYLEKDTINLTKEKAELIDSLYTIAFEKWKDLYQYCSGASQWHPYDGIRIYTYFAKKESNKEKQAKYHAQVLKLHDDFVLCFGNKVKLTNFIIKRKALYMMFQAKSDPKETFETFGLYITRTENNTKASIFSPYLYLARTLYRKNELSKEEMRAIDKKMTAIADFNIENTKDEKRRLSYEKAKVEIRKFDDLKDPIFDCEYFVEKLKPLYEEHSEDLNFLRNEILVKLKKANCPESNEFRRKIAKRIIMIPITCPTNRSYGHIAYKKGNYEEAIQYYLREVEDDEGSRQEKAELLLRCAKIAFAKLKDFPRARTYAEQALEYRPNWIEVYLLIGDLYAASSSICKTEEDFNKELFIWIAINEWNKVKTGEGGAKIKETAEERIRKYKPYLSTEEDFSVNKLQKDKTYFVPCWIQRSTIVRSFE